MAVAKAGLLFLGLLSVGWCKNEKLKEVFHWKQVDFAWPSQEARDEMIKLGHFKQENNLPLGLEVWKDKLFITVPRWKSGVPASLNYVNIHSGEESPALIPYPNWEMHNITKRTNETKLVNTFRIRADACDRLWVIDCGLNDILGGAQAVTPTKLLVFDLNSDTLIRKYNFMPSLVKEDSFFANVVVDVTPGSCENTFAYIPDLGSPGLVVYNWMNDEAWRVKHHFFHFDPLQGDYNIGGINFQWTDGIFGIALSPVGNDGYRTLYFHPLSSTREFAVSTRIVQNETLASNSYGEYKVLGSRGPQSQATASFLDEKSGVVFYTQVNKDAVGCWNSYKNPTEYSADTNGIVAADNVTMVFPNDLKVDRDSNLWVLTDRLPAFIYRKLDNNEINFRILMAPVPEAIKGTVCADKN